MEQPIRTVDSRGNVFHRVDGTLHNEEGPAIEFSSGAAMFFLNGVEMPYKEWKQKTYLSSGKYTISNHESWIRDYLKHREVRHV